VGFCEHGNEPSGPIKGWEFPHQLSDCQLLKKNSAPWSYYYNTTHLHLLQRLKNIIITWHVLLKTVLCSKIMMSVFLPLFATYDIQIQKGSVFAVFLFPGTSNLEKLYLTWLLSTK